MTDELRDVLDVYVYRTGVVELRRPRALERGKSQFVELAAPRNIVHYLRENTVFPSMELETITWAIANYDINGVRVWMEV